MAEAATNQQVADAEYIYKNLKDIEHVVTSMKGLNKEVEAECKRHEVSVKEIKGKIAALQQYCHHWSRTYHPDPSGNNDSFYECDVCGKYM